ncbi:uncharacterized protein LOC111642049 [Centruroides sculpturatus]|uniref:uncharacterized protein LOC111642049 n=1 Tax=Centruroides sculpturatus TaxID=218467 RepID=UPI000C6D5115|nr:uncharacterized protein LOC111642049 [Centruroides sculpturatus]
MCNILTIMVILLLLVTIKDKFDDLAEEIYNYRVESVEMKCFLRYCRHRFKECCHRLEEFNLMYKDLLSFGYCSLIFVTCFLTCMLLYVEMDKVAAMFSILILIGLTFIAAICVLSAAELNVSAISPLMELKRFCTLEMATSDRLKLICTLKLLDGPTIGIKCLEFTFTKISLIKMIESEFSFLSSLKEIRVAQEKT